MWHITLWPLLLLLLFIECQKFYHVAELKVLRNAVATCYFVSFELQGASSSLCMSILILAGNTDGGSTRDRKDNASKSCCEWDRGNLHQCNICQPLPQILWRFWKDSEITIWNGKNLKYAHFPLTNNLWYMNFGWRRTRIDKNPYFQLSLVLYASISFHRPVVLFYNFIAINIILVDLLHDVTEKETAIL